MIFSDYGHRDDLCKRLDRFVLGDHSETNRLTSDGLGEKFNRIIGAVAAAGLRFSGAYGESSSHQM